MKILSETRERKGPRVCYLRTRIVAVLVGILALSTCFRERPTTVELRGGATPVFVLSGGGELVSFSVYALPPNSEKMDKPISDQTPVWRILAQPDWRHGRRLEEIGRLTYGVVPSGYKQDSPSAGIPPPAIIPGEGYFFNSVTADAAGTAGTFRLLNGKTVPADIQLPCEAMKNGKRVTVPCAARP